MGRSSSIFQVSFYASPIPPRPRQKPRRAYSIISTSALLYTPPMASMDYLSMVRWATSVDNNAKEPGAWDMVKRQLAPHTWLTYTDRLYLASYTTPPSSDTVFPYPDPPPARRSPTKRSARAVDGPSVISQQERSPPCYFSVDDSLLYNAFHHDFGPLHIGHLYRFAVKFHDILGAPENKDKPVVFWSKADARSE